MAAAVEVGVHSIVRHGRKNRPGFFPEKHKLERSACASFQHVFQGKTIKGKVFSPCLTLVIYFFKGLFQS